MLSKTYLIVYSIRFLLEHVFFKNLNFFIINHYDAYFNSLCLAKALNLSEIKQLKLFDKHRL